MTETEYANLINCRPSKASGALLENKTPRTLVYGYTFERNTFHLYLDGAGVIHRVIYDGDDLLIDHEEGELALHACVPDKRVYPQKCDLEFCRLLTGAGQSIPFTTFSECSARAFHGLQMEELGVKIAQLAFPEVDLGNVLEGYDFSNDRYHSVETATSAVERIVDGQVDGYVRAILVRREEPARAQRWLDNIEMSVNQVIGLELKKDDVQKIMSSVGRYLRGINLVIEQPVSA